MKEPFIIAEMSGNHNNSIEIAKNIIVQAKACGVDAVKIQTYTADTITLDSDDELFMIRDESSPWNGYKLYDLYQIASTPWEWHKELFSYAKEIGVVLFSSPFDPTAVDLLEDCGNPIYKIASFEIVDLPLIRYAANTGKPMIMSTGIATLQEIDEAVNAALKAGASDVTLLHCVSSYPSDARSANLKTMQVLSEIFGLPVGLSDHSEGIGVAVAAVALGAEVIEKHFVLDRSAGGVDSSFSLEPDEFRMLTSECRRASASIGKTIVRLHAEENKKQRQFARSLFAVKDIQIGELYTVDNVRSIRPGDGLAPKYLDQLLGKKAPRLLKRGTPLSKDLLHNI